MFLEEIISKKVLPADFLTNRRTKKLKIKEEIVLLPFTEEYLEELMSWLEHDGNKSVLKEFFYGSKRKHISEGNLKSLFYKYQICSHTYKPLRMCIKTSYKCIIPIGNAHITKSIDDEKCQLKKFYIDKMWRSKGYEEK
jgi:hypothetical protein